MEAETLQNKDFNEKIHSSKDTNGEVNHSGDGPVVNGFSNGLSESLKKEEHRDKHKDKHKDKHRDKDRERDRDKHRDKERDREKEKSRDKDKEREKDRDKHKDRDKDHKSSSHKSSSRDKERERDKDKERKEKDREKDKSRDKDREKEKNKDGKEKDEKSISQKDKEKSSSSNKHHSSSSGKSDKDKHKSSSSGSSKDKEKHRDRDKEKDKEREKDKYKDKEREKSKHSSSSSSNKDKERKEKSSSDKVKDSHKDRSSSSHKEKSEKSHREKEDESKTKNKRSVLDDSFEDEEPVFKEEMVEVKKEVDVSIKEEEEEEDNDVDEDALYIKEEPVDEMDQTNDNSSFDTSRIKSEQQSEEEDDDDDVPLSARASKRPPDDDEEEDDDDIPLAKKKIKKEKESKKKRKKGYESEEEYFEEEDEESFKPKKSKKSSITPAKKIKTETKVKMEKSLNESQTSPTKKKKKEEEQEVWKWWEEEKKDSKTKWNYLEHKGPVFAPPYEPLPSNVKFFYDGKEMRLSESAEEVATFYARMLEHDYVTKEAFNKNFFKDWRKMMTPKEKETITDLSKCNFKAMHAYFVQKSEERKNKTKEEKKALKEENDQMIEEYGFCIIDGHKEKIGNFKLEPPGLFRGRGEHPKMGMLKKRLNAEDIIINCSKDSNIPKPPEGHRWKEVRHDNSVTWLASWTENVQGQVKYIMLNPSSKLKGEKDWQKYETARKLHKCIDKIRREYKEDWKSKEMRIRQRAVALYFIDKLALRAGNEKDEDQADTVGCCSLRVEHISLHPEIDGKEFVVVFDFLGKDSIRYYNEVPVEKRVFKNLQLFVENKKPGDDLFDRLNTQILNKHLNELMEGLTAKVFRTYNASITLQQQLDLLTDPNYSVPEKILAYNRANRAVAILCNHQRSIPKSHQKSMENLKEKISSKKEAIEEAEKQYKSAKRESKNGSAKEKINADKAKKKLERLKEQLTKLEVQETDREENKTIALGTSKLNYLDPRISVAWCKKYDIPIDKVYNKTQRSKFRWAIDMAGPDYIF